MNLKLRSFAISLTAMTALIPNLGADTAPRLDATLLAKGLAQLEDHLPQLPDVDIGTPTIEDTGAATQRDLQQTAKLEFPTPVITNLTPSNTCPALTTALNHINIAYAQAQEFRANRAMEMQQIRTTTFNQDLPKPLLGYISAAIRNRIVFDPDLPAINKGLHDYFTELARNARTAANDCLIRDGKMM
ncbi:MAG: hypothetical protein H6922_01480 [Pseudomonadaceae bacterium]|nr:hypothetical protein [Pseudomonadaceae bacterium]